TPSTPGCGAAPDPRRPMKKLQENLGARDTIMITRQKRPAQSTAILSLLPREDVEQGRAAEATMAKRQVAVYMWPDSKIGEGSCVYAADADRETLDMSHVQWNRDAHPVFHAGTYRVVFLDGETPDRRRGTVASIPPRRQAPGVRREAP